MLLCVIVGASAQMTKNDLAPDFSLTDINGQTHTLYGYLGQGKSVILNFFDAGASPCWVYHTQGELQNLQSQHGDSIQVLNIEINYATDNLNINGVIGTGQPANITMGNWTTNNPSPIINLTPADSNFLKAYKVPYAPTIYTVCPERLVQISGLRTAAQHMEFAKTECVGLPDTVLRPKVIQYVGSRNICNNQVIRVAFVIQNQGTDTITNGNYALIWHTIQLFSKPWSGILPPLDTVHISFPRFTFTYNDFLYYAFVAKKNGSNSPLTGEFLPIGHFDLTAPERDSSVLLEITTDQFGDEITWELISSINEVVASGGPYPKLAAPGVSSYQIPITLQTGECYKFIMKDQFGDGVCCDYGQGFYRLTDRYGSLIAEGDEMFTVNTHNFTTGFFADTEPTDFGNWFAIYPVPATNSLTLEVPKMYQGQGHVTLVNTLGATLETRLLDQSQVVFDISNQPEGVYFLKMEVGGKSWTEKFVKTQP